MAWNVSVTIFADSRADYVSALEALTSGTGLTAKEVWDQEAAAKKSTRKPKEAGAAAPASDAPAPGPTSAPSPESPPAPTLGVVDGRRRLRAVIGEDEGKRLAAELILKETYKVPSITQLSGEQLLGFVEKIEKEIK